jgi:hypothetical protein
MKENEEEYKRGCRHYSFEHEPTEERAGTGGGALHGLENIYWIGHRGEGPSHAGQHRTVCILS